jgi:hypothetical protein
VSKYNSCKGKPTRPAKKKPAFGIVAGYINSTMSLPPFTFTRQPGFKLGLAIDFLPKSYEDKTVLSIHAVYASEKIVSRDDLIESDNVTLRIPVLLKRYVAPGQSGFFYYPGFSFYTSMNYEAHGLPALQTKNLGISYFGGFGYEIILPSGRRLTPSIRYERDAVSFFNFNLGARQSSIQVDFSFKF